MYKNNLIYKIQKSDQQQSFSSKHGNFLPGCEELCKLKARFQQIQNMQKQSAIAALHDTVLPRDTFVHKLTVNQQLWCQCLWTHLCAQAYCKLTSGVSASLHTFVHKLKVNQQLWCQCLTTYLCPQTHCKPTTQVSLGPHYTLLSTSLR